MSSTPILGEHLLLHPLQNEELPSFEITPEIAPAHQMHMEHMLAACTLTVEVCTARLQMVIMIEMLFSIG